METLNADPRYEEARKQMLEIKGFYSHLASYLLVNAFLITLNLLTSPNQLWFYWPLLGWGFGLAAHGISVFGKGAFVGRNWEEKKTQQILDRMKNNG